jgi:ABC-type glycerol-3-phosphate transport system substrate-binding protein
VIKKIISFFSIFLLFTGISFSAKSAEKIALVIGTWAEGPLTPYVEKFTAETGIEVDIQTFPFRDLLATLEVRGNAKADDIDVVFVDAPLVPSYAVRGMIAPMDSYFADANVNEIFAPAGIAAASWNGEMYAPPLNNSGQILYYNKDLLAKAGCAEPSCN